MLQINNVKVKLGPCEYNKILSQVLNIHYKRISDVTLVKQAIDARRKSSIHYVCSFTFNVDNEEQVLNRNKKLQISVYKPFYYKKGKPTNEKIVVVGSGPAGLFLAYQLARSNQKVILLERGSAVEQRCLDVERFIEEGALNLESNIQFGEGGAGTFSDGKLTASSKDPRKQFVLETMVRFGAKKDILYRNKPHVGTDYLRGVVKGIREYIIEQGGEVIFNALMNDIDVVDGAVKKVGFVKQDKQTYLDVDHLVVATGHSARDTYKLLFDKGVKMEQKPFAVGLRIEHLQSFVNFSQYGNCNTKLPAADYKLAVSPNNDRGVYTFCMCPGGEVVNASSHEGKVVVNGMSNYKRNDVNANSAILVTVNHKDFNSEDVFAGMEFQEKLENSAFKLGGSNYAIPIQSVESYLGIDVVETDQVIECSVKGNTKEVDLKELFSDEVNNSIKEGLLLMNQKIPGFTSNAILVGVESRSSAPIRVLRDDKMQSSIKGLYPLGEGAGFAGGIMSSAIDGLKCAEILLQGE